MPRQGEEVTSHPSHPLDPPLVLDRKTAELAAEAPRSNRSISPARWAHSSKPATRCRWDRHTDRQTDRQTPCRYNHRSYRILCEQCQ